ncbi:unnamed protein product [Prunus armeniaca]
MTPILTYLPNTRYYKPRKSNSKHPCNKQNLLTLEQAACAPPLHQLARVLFPFFPAAACSPMSMVPACIPLPPFPTPRPMKVILLLRLSSLTSNMMTRFRKISLFSLFNGSLRHKVLTTVATKTTAHALVNESNLFAVIMNNVGPLYENRVATSQARETPIGMLDLEALLLLAERRLQASSSLAISFGATPMVASCGGRGGRSFGDRGGFVSCASDRRTSLSTPHFGSSLGSRQGVLRPPPSGLNTSSFGSNSSSPQGPLQCYNCRGYGHIATVCPSKASSVPTPPTHLQGMIAHHLSHGGTQQWVADTRANT